MVNRAIAPSHFPKNINQYVPAMAYEAGMAFGEAVEISLGTPKLADANGILDDVVADATVNVYNSATPWEVTFDGSSTSLTSTVGMMDAPYGRNVTMTGTAGSDHVITVTGRDYLGQIMTENLTLVATAVIVGHKAFKWIDSVSAAAGAAGDTFDMGWGDKLGLPYKLGKLLHARENGIYVAPQEELIRVGPEVVVTSGANAGTFTAPRDGWVIGFEAEITVAATVADATMDVIIGGTGVAGLDFSIGWGTSDENLGAKYGNLLAPGLANADVKAGDVVTATSDGGHTAGSAAITMLQSPGYGHHHRPDITDPALVSTRDTRGTYEAFSTLDGTLEIFVTMQADNSINASENGGLHGIKQV